MRAAPNVLWLHDVDMSPRRALALARLEADEGITATYFVMPSSAFYNLFEREVREPFEAVAALGHRLGLHFDLGAWASGGERRQRGQGDNGVGDNGVRS